MVSFAEVDSSGRPNWITQELRRAQQATAALERGITRPLQVKNVTPSGLLIGNAEDTLFRIRECLLACNRLYRQGNTIMFLRGGNGGGAGSRPTMIVVDDELTKSAAAKISNVVMCCEQKANSKGKGAKVDQPDVFEVHFSVPNRVLEQVFAMDGFMEEIPEARYIVNHPVFDRDFNWLDCGYHASQGILVCGDSFEPAIIDLPLSCGEIHTVHDVLERLPPLIRGWVEGFFWAGPIDLINYVGAALMTPLMPMLVDDGHPGVMTWANKTGIGKTVSCQCLAILKDGEPAAVTSVESGPREVENQIASEMNDGGTVVFIDNQKGVLNVAILEANMTAKLTAIRGFGVQRKVRRPNDLLWLITTNDAIPSDDMLSRCIHVRLHYEGDPDARQFAMSEGELLNYVRENRAGILAELAGMVVRWLDAGRPSAPAPSRFKAFGQIIGSVLTANGLPGLLANTKDEVRQHSTTHQQLVAVADRLLEGRDRAFVIEVGGDIEGADDEFKRGPRPVNPREQKDWVPCLMSAGVITTAQATPEKQKKAATQFLNSILKVACEVQYGEHTVQAMVVSRPLGQRRVAYALAVKGMPSLDADGAGDGDGACSSNEPGDGQGPCGADQGGVDDRHDEGPGTGSCDGLNGAERVDPGNDLWV